MFPNRVVKRQGEASLTPPNPPQPWFSRSSISPPRWSTNPRGDEAVDDRRTSPHRPCASSVCRVPGDPAYRHDLANRRSAGITACVCQPDSVVELRTRSGTTWHESAAAERAPVSLGPLRGPSETDAIHAAADRTCRRTISRDSLDDHVFRDVPSIPAPADHRIPMDEDGSAGYELLSIIFVIFVILLAHMI